VCKDGSACHHTTITCGDNDICNGTEICDAATGCVAGDPLVCDDGNICTADSCDATTGCAFTADPDAGAADDTTCDGVDDDCDGGTDEDFVGAATACGTGPCAATGEMVCNAGVEEDSCVAITPGEELCNGLDDNCDGDVDDGFDLATRWPDSDGDGYGELGSSSVLVCADAEGFSDNADDCNDGDENIHPTAVDTPDDEAADTNCDGIDGDAAALVFVSEGATGIGTMTSPLSDIQAGIAACQGIGESCTGVAVSQGNYTGRITVVDGISVYGGYATDWKERGDSYPVKVTADDPGDDGLVNVDALDITSATTVERLKLVHGADATALGSSAYGVRAINAAGLRLRHLQVTAGEGADGAAGQDGVDGTAGVNGTNGFNADCGNKKDDWYNYTNNYLGTGQGWGATNDACPGVNGGNGGGNTPDKPGAPGGATAGGACGGGGGAEKGCPWNNGYPGCDGTAGVNGVDGSGGDGLGSVTEPGLWEGTPGTDGTLGTHGTGGGGGGGGGSTNYVHAGGGGGGGAGGCGGTGGTAAGGAGGSFGLYAVQSTGLQVELCTFKSGKGGVGGEGGQAGDGGAASLGGTAGKGHYANCTPGSSTYCSTGQGGKGGDGGAGGNGGLGGGGSGGVAYGIFCHDGFITMTDTTGTGGVGGDGGTGPMFLVPSLGVSVPGGNGGEDGKVGDVVGCD